MKIYHFRVYSKLAKKWYYHTKLFNTKKDFSLFCKALYSCNYELISIEQ